MKSVEVGAASVMLAAIFLSANSGEAVADPPNCPSKDVYTAEQAEAATVDGSCDLEGAIVAEGGLAVAVPAEGEGIEMAATFEDGSTDLEVVVTDSGQIEATTETSISADSSVMPSDESAPGVDEDDLRSGAPSGCDDGYYNVPDSDTDGGFSYYVSTAVSGGIPYVVDERAILAKSANTIEDASDCGYSDQVSLFAFSEGDTSRTANIGNRDGARFCGQNDKYNVIDFNNLDNNGRPPLATTCTWLDGRSGRDRIVNYDTRFNIANYKWTSTPAAGSCNAERFDFESVAVHEFGHAVGLVHVGEAAHGNLTMSTTSPRCSTAPRTLGKGDIAALRSIY